LGFLCDIVRLSIIEADQPIGSLTIPLLIEMDKEWRMTLPANRPDTSRMPPISEQRHEASRRRRTIYQSLQPVLPPAKLNQALALCERDFPLDEPFSVAEFCQRLAESPSNISLSKEARLVLLRTMRQRAETLGRDPLPVQETAEEAVASAALEVEAESGGYPEAQHEPQNRIDEDGTVERMRPELENLASPTEQIAYCTTTGRPYDGDRPSPELWALRYANFGQPIVALDPSASGKSGSQSPSGLGDEAG
jgi:hypothetical protein